MSNSRILMGISLLLIILLFGLSEHTFAQKIRIEKEDGVTVIYNAKYPIIFKDSPSQLSFKDDLLIGVESGDENYMFSDISRIEVDDKDDIIIMDAKEGCIKIFDKNGKFIRRFGEKGQGPGEIQSFGRMSLSNNLITINDVSNHRFSYYDKNGECIRQIPTGKFRPPDTLADTKGNLYGGVLSFEDRIFTKLMKFDQDFSPLLTITSFEMPKQVPPAILMERIYFKVRRDDSLVWGRTSKYELNILNNENKIEMRIIRDFNPVKVTVNNLKEEMKEWYPDRPIPQNFSIPSHFPKQFPVFYYFICDDEGRIYVLHLLKNGENKVFDVFDKKGRYFNSFTHPATESLAVIKNGKAYFITEANEAGIPQLKRYTMEWK